MTDLCARNSGETALLCQDPNCMNRTPSISGCNQAPPTIEPTVGELGLCGQGDDACAPQCCRTGNADTASWQEILKDRAPQLLVIPAPEPTRAERIAEVAEKMGSTSVLVEAEGIVNGARAAAYGHPTPNHAKIARLWNAYLENLEEEAVDGQWQLSPVDVAQMMILLKLARLQYSPGHHDSLVDIAGYTACAERMTNGTYKGEVQ